MSQEGGRPTRPATAGGRHGRMHGKLDLSRRPSNKNALTQAPRPCEGRFSLTGC
jgi:hypothetical protein